MITLIKRSAPRCPACNNVQAVLDGRGLEYETIDITEQPDAIEEYDLQSVPVALIDGKKYEGFGAIMEAINE